MKLFGPSKLGPVLVTLSLSLDPITHHPRLTATASSNTEFVIQASPDLQNWTAIATNLSSTNRLQYLDTNAPAYPQRFYRAVVGAGN